MSERALAFMHYTGWSKQLGLKLFVTIMVLHHTKVHFSRFWRKTPSTLNSVGGVFCSTFLDSLSTCFKGLSHRMLCVLCWLLDCLSEPQRTEQVLGGVESVKCSAKIMHLFPSLTYERSFISRIGCVGRNAQQMWAVFTQHRPTISYVTVAAHRWKQVMPPHAVSIQTEACVVGWPEITNTVKQSGSRDHVQNWWWDEAEVAFLTYKEESFFFFFLYSNQWWLENCYPMETCLPIIFTLTRFSLQLSV